MKRFAVVTVALFSFTAAAADDAKDKAIKQEREKLQGKWKLVSAELEGKERTPPDDAVVVIDGDKWKTEVGEKKWEHAIQIDPTQNPKTIDLTMKSRDEKQKDVVIKGIYKLDKDTLTVCLALRPREGANERVKEFKSTEGHVINVYKRAEK